MIKERHIFISKERDSNCRLEVRQSQDMQLSRGERELVEGLCKEEQNYRLLFESTPFPMWVYDLETLQFLTVNEKAIRCYGYSQEEFLAMTIKEIRPPEDIPFLLQYIVKPPAEEFVRAARHRKKDGTIISVRIAGQPIIFKGRRARLVVVTDIKQSKPTENTWQRTLDALNATRDGVYIFNPDTLRFSYVNKGAEEQTGYSKEELLEMTPADINPDLKEKSFRRIITRLVNGSRDSHFFVTRTVMTFRWK
jgi:PAS domain S-box-containing protein